MPILTVEFGRTKKAGTLAGRVLIGRWPLNTIVVDDPSVSRIHAWISTQDDRYYVADTGSRSGTFVNGQELSHWHLLDDGDEIRIGPVVLRYGVVPAPPANLEILDLSPRPADALSGETGQFYDCICGAPLWLPKDYGAKSRCRYCGHLMKKLQRAAAAPTSSTAAPAAGPLPTAPSAAAPSPREQCAWSGRVESGMDQPPSRIDGLRPEAVSASMPAEMPEQGSAADLLPPADPPLVQAEPSQTPTAQPRPVCGVCHSPITASDLVQSCASCGLRFHSECWTENRGCAAFGCSEVGALEARA